MQRLDFHNQGEEKKRGLCVPLLRSGENVTHFNPAHIGLQQDLLKLETLPPAITSSVNLTTSARFVEVIESNIQEPGKSESVI